MKILVQSFKSKPGLDDNYSLYDNGSIIHKYDRHIYKGGQDRTEELTPEQLSDEIKQQLLDDCPEENKTQVKIILKVV
jgi:hypothetical protein